MAEKDLMAMAQAVADRMAHDMERAATHLLGNTLGLYMKETIAAGGEPSREGLRAWAEAHAAKDAARAPLFAEVVRFLDENPSTSRK